MECRGRLELRPKPWCPRCGSPVFAVDVRCPEDHRAIRGLVICRAPFVYRGVGGELVRRFKFEGDRGSLGLMAREMADAIEPWTCSAGRRGVFVSVPIHPTKRRARGFDHAGVLAETVARRVGRAFVPNAMRRLRATLPQGDVRVTSRLENVRDAFAVSRPARMDNRVVVLVDDVRTSGHTAMECARVLRLAGVRKIALLTAAQS